MKKKIIVCAVISSVVVVALIATILVLRFSDMNGDVPADDTTSDSANVIDPPGRISIPGFDEIVLKSDEWIQNVSFKNPESNRCYFVITLYMQDGSLLYKSDLIAPGETINRICLTQLLKTGVYENCVLNYACYSVDDFQQLNGINTIFTLEVSE